MARKRKIPARKHHGVRDPLKQKFELEQKLKHVTNNPPEKGNDQKVSYKFSQFMKLAKDVKSGKRIKRIHRGIEDKPKKGRLTNPSFEHKISSIKQHSNEDDEDYLRRVNRITSNSLKEAEYEIKYGVSVVKNPKTGSIVIKKREPNEVDELLKNNKSKKQTKQKINKIDPKYVKELVKQAIKESEEEKRNEKHIEEYKKDVVPFGEVVHAPPSLLTLPRKATKSDTVPRPGMKDNLLLKTMFKPQSPATSNSLKNKTSQTKSTNRLKGKRKDLPIATRNMLETEQSKMIQLYRELKKNQLNKHV